MKRILIVLLALAMVFSLSACGGSGSAPAPEEEEAGEAVEFPTDSISLIVPYAPGGASDTVARIFAQELEKVIGVPVVVSNQTGASGAVGLQFVADSKPDGYTVAYMPVESTMIRALGFTELSTDDFKFIGRSMTIPAAITVRADSEWQTFDDFIAYAKEHPGEILMGNSGTGSIWHVAAASVEDACDVTFTHVPFDGAAPAIAALLGSNIHAVAVSPSEVKTNYDNGDFRILAILGEGRSSVAPDVLTAQEMGIDVTAQGWGGFAVPKDTPDEIVQILNDAAATALNSDPVKDLLKERGFEFAYLTGPEMDAVVKEQLEYYDELIPSLGISQ